MEERGVLGSEPSAMSLNDMEEQLCRPVRVWNASEVYYKRVLSGFMGYDYG